MAAISGALRVATQPDRTAAAGPAAPFATTTTGTAQQSAFGDLLATAAGIPASPADRAAAVASGLLPDDTDQTALTDSTQAAAQAAAGLLVVAPGIVLSSSGSPVNAASDAGTTAANATTTAATGTDETLSRATQLQLRLAAAPQALPQGVNTLPTAAQPAVPQPQQSQTNTNPNAATGTNTAAIPGTPANPLNTAQIAQTVTNATGLPAGQTPIVPPQAPVVASLVPPNTAPPATPDLPPQQVQATAEAGGLPNVMIGDRPTMAGERFAAIVADADRLRTQAAQPGTGAFAGVLAGTTAAQAGTANATVAPLSAVVTAVTALPDGSTSGSTGFTPGGSDPFAVAGLVGRTISGTGRAVPANFADVVRDQASDGTATAAVNTLTTQPAQANSQTPQTAPTASTPPTPAVQVADQVVAHARALDHNGTTEFQIRLDPPELGRVRVHLISDADGIRGQVVVADDAVRKMIESQLPELRQRLEQAGVSVGRFDVATDPGTGGNSRAFQGDDRPGFAPPAAAANTRLPLPRVPAGRPATGTLDVMV